MSTKEFEINGVVYHPENKYNEDELNDLFIEWVESIGLLFGGTITDITQG